MLETSESPPFPLDIIPLVSLDMESLAFFGSCTFFLGRPLLALALEAGGGSGWASDTGTDADPISGHAVGAAVLLTIS